MTRFEWKLPAKWNLPSLLGERRDRRNAARSTFRPRVDALEGRALLSHISAKAVKHPVAVLNSIVDRTGGSGSGGGGGGGAVSIDLGGGGMFTPLNGKNLLGGAVLNGPLPVVHVFNSHGKVIGVRPILPDLSFNDDTGANGSVNLKTGGGGGGGGGGVSFAMVPELGALPKFGLIHGKLYKIFPPTNTALASVTDKTGGDGAGSAGGGAGISILIPFQVTFQTVKVKNVMAVRIVVATPPAAGTTGTAAGSIDDETGGNGGPNGGGGGGAISIIL